MELQRLQVQRDDGKDDDDHDVHENDNSQDTYDTDDNVATAMMTIKKKMRGKNRNK